MVVQMIAVGEDSGSMETMLRKVAEFYDSEVESTTKALTSLIEPLLIAVLGIVIGGMIVALYMPIFGLAQAVQSAATYARPPNWGSRNPRNTPGWGITSGFSGA